MTCVSNGMHGVFVLDLNSVFRHLSVKLCGGIVLMMTGAPSCPGTEGSDSYRDVATGSRYH